MPLNLTDRQTIAQLMQSHGLHTQKRFGQHFLTNPSILQTIVTAANIQPTDTVLEVGAGIGVLTQELSQRAECVVAYEIDITLQPVLEETLKEYSNIELRFADFLKDFSYSSSERGSHASGRPWNSEQSENSEVTRGAKPSQPIAPDAYKLVANLPYNAGSHILGQLITSANPPQSITVLLQKEVADKIVAQIPHSTYLSNFFQAYGQAHIVQTVAPGNFFPPPKVDSAILHISKSDDAPEINLPAWSKFLHHGFANPRKMLNKAFDKDLLEEASIDPSLRPENLTFDSWLQLFKIWNKVV